MSREPGWVLRKMEGAEALEGGEGLEWFKWQMGVGTHYRDQDLLREKSRKRMAPELYSQLCTANGCSSCPQAPDISS